MFGTFLFKVHYIYVYIYIFFFVRTFYGSITSDYHTLINLKPKKAIVALLHIHQETLRGVAGSGRRGREGGGAGFKVFVTARVWA